jgi:hypothetical protein
MQNLLQQKGLSGSLINDSVRHNVRAGVSMHFFVEKMKFMDGWQIFTDLGFPSYHAYIKNEEQLLKAIIPDGIITIKKSESGTPIKVIRPL